jgi:hypothetical protein
MAEEVEIPDLEAGSSASIVARWVLMLSHLYYDRGVSLVDDATYDELCRQTVEAWDELPEHLQQQIDDPEALLSTGMGVYLSRQSIAGAEALARSQDVELPPYEFRPDYECGCCEAELATIRG